MTKEADLFDAIPEYKALSPRDKMLIWNQISLAALIRAAREVKALSVEEIRKHASDSGHPEIFLDCLGMSLKRSLEKFANQ